ncbi:MAG TPA: hypothetical protein DEP45_05195 [Armatimonadetes bacterium]|nr:hypothetical protein [Armatimonadota bacterium]
MLCGVDRDGCMATASGVDFDEAKAAVDWKLDELHGGPATEGGNARPSSWPGAPVRVNELGVAELAEAAGISEELAAAVVMYRTENGQFTCGPDIGCVPHPDRGGLMHLAIVADYGSGGEGIAVHLSDLPGGAR